ncbi:RNA polymerase sigma factor [Hyunsoonleella pacifica]|uniref:RNA polymerase sigma factor n=1 Tax=Hyunsoonleella pacifica TaxID=1080224 RepID=A0A4Q9FSM0_9FLAO|nr:RNA polymerase sigma factor [Hyunsoonleella pacifica]TBN17856.1 RNA polymerase sigma factor [Hyunsoonleella pacifica]GGD08281.1 DNA-directed RNA polymerase subunit sigma [Hyunsoonleella pacifica]
MTPNHQNIENLIELCISGNQSAQLEIYNRYYKAMYNTSLRIVKNSFEAEDIMQDSFLMAFTKLNTLKDKTVFGSWLKRIVINNSIHHYKKQSNKQETPLNDTLFKVEDQNTNDTTNHAEVSLKIKQVLDGLNSLKDNYRVALTLNLIEGFDYGEVSEIMNISNANCRTIISRAKSSLRQKLEHLRVN